MTATREFASSWWDGPNPVPGDTLRVPAPPGSDELWVVQSVAEGPGCGQWRMVCTEASPEHVTGPGTTYLWRTGSMG